MKNKKAKNKYIKSLKEIIPIRIYDENLSAFKLKDNSYMDMLHIIARDVDNMNYAEINNEFMSLIKILKVISQDIKFVSMNFSLDASSQKEHLEDVKNILEDEVRVKWIDRQIDELERAENGIMTREYYIFFFGKNEDEFIKNKEMLLSYLTHGYLKLAEELEKNEKINILKKLFNMNTEQNLYSEYKLEENIIKDGKTGQIDMNLFEAIQPKGGITFKAPSYSEFGDGYVRCIHIYELPASVYEFWLNNIFNVSDCICTFDVHTKDILEVKKNIQKSIREEDARYKMARDHEESFDAEKRREELRNLYYDIEQFGEVIKLVDFRIFVKSTRLEELEELTERIVSSLSSNSYKVTSLLNEQKSEYLSFCEPYSKTHQRNYMMKGLTLTSEQLSIGFPFNFSELTDKDGFLLGFTKIGGSVIFNPFLKTKNRKHYNALVAGDMGSGKSTFLKKIFKFMASKNSYVRVFDVAGEFNNLTKEFGGKILKCNGTDGMLNPLEILNTDEDDKVSYANHINKMSSFFKCISPSIEDETLQELSNELGNFYKIYGIDVSKDDGITGLDPEKYPILSNFREYLKKSISILNELDKKAETDVQTTLNINKAVKLNNILSIVENLINNYGILFDGHSTIRDITKEKIVNFDISQIKDLGNVFTAQMQNLVSLCWDNAVSNGKIMKQKWEDKEIDTHEIVNSLILIDESHRWVNSSMPLILDMIIRYQREARKYFAGIILASQSIRDFMPESSGESLEKIRLLFELSQYKFMFKQDSSVKEFIKKVFASNITENQIEKIPMLEMGENILSIAGDRSIEFKVWLSKDYEEQLFSGGR